MKSYKRWLTVILVIKITIGIALTGFRIDEVGFKITLGHMIPF